MKLSRKDCDALCMLALEGRAENVREFCGRPGMLSASSQDKSHFWRALSDALGRMRSRGAKAIEEACACSALLAKAGLGADCETAPGVCAFAQCASAAPELAQALAEAGQMPQGEAQLEQLRRALSPRLAAGKDAGAILALLGGCSGAARSADAKLWCERSLFWAPKAALAGSEAGPCFGSGDWEGFLSRFCAAGLDVDRPDAKGEIGAGPESICTPLSFLVKWTARLAQAGVLWEGQAQAAEGIAIALLGAGADPMLQMEQTGGIALMEWAARRPFSEGFSKQIEKAALDKGLDFSAATDVPARAKRRGL